MYPENNKNKRKQIRLITRKEIDGMIRILQTPSV